MASRLADRPRARIVSKRLSRARVARIFNRVARLQAQNSRPLSRKLERYFDAQMARLVADLRDGAKAPNRRARIVATRSPFAFTQAELNSIKAVIRPSQEAMARQSADLLGALVGQTEALTATEVESLVGRASERMTNVGVRTAARVDRILLNATAEGLTETQVLAQIRDLGPKMAGRASTIARTEMAITSQESALSRYAQAGATHVEISDGPECGWTAHEDGDLADGSTRTLAEARAYPIAHPNCVRVAIPLV